MELIRNRIADYILAFHAHQSEPNTHTHTHAFQIVIMIKSCQHNQHVARTPVGPRKLRRATQHSETPFFWFIIFWGRAVYCGSLICNVNFISRFFARLSLSIKTPCNLFGLFIHEKDPTRISFFSSQSTKRENRKQQQNCSINKWSRENEMLFWIFMRLIASNNHDEMFEYTHQER